MAKGKEKSQIAKTQGGGELKIKADGPIDNTTSGSMKAPGPDTAYPKQDMAAGHDLSKGYKVLSSGFMDGKGSKESVSKAGSDTDEMD